MSGSEIPKMQPSGMPEGSSMQLTQFVFPEGEEAPVEIVATVAKNLGSNVVDLHHGLAAHLDAKAIAKAGLYVKGGKTSRLERLKRYPALFESKRRLCGAEPEAENDEERTDIADYLQGIFEVNPGAREAALTDLDEKAESLRQFHFDDPNAQQQINDAHASLRWLAADNRGETPPVAFNMFGRVLQTFNTARNQYHAILTKAVQPLFGEFDQDGNRWFFLPSTLDEQLKVHLEDTLAYRFIASFNDQHHSERPLTEAERHIKEQQYLGQIAADTGVARPDVLRPYIAEDDQAGAAHSRYRKRLGQIDVMTVPGGANEQPVDALSRFRAYFAKNIGAKDRADLELRIQQLEYKAGCDGLAEFCEQITGSKYATADNTVLLNFVLRAIPEVPLESTLSELLDKAVETTASSFYRELSYSWGGSGGMLPPSPYTWLVKQPHIDEAWEKAMAERKKRPSIYGTAAAPQRMMSGEELKNAEELSYGRVLFDADEKEFDGSEPAPRLVAGALASIHRQKLPADTRPSLRLSYQSHFVGQYFGTEKLPYIVGYELIGQAETGDTIEYDFVRVPGDTSYETCQSIVPADKKTGITDYLDRQGLTYLRDAIANEPELTVEQLRRTIARESRYYVPETLTAENMIIDQGRANFQCVGASQLIKELLTITGLGMARIVGGQTIRRNGRITTAGHSIVLYREGEKQYVLDAQPQARQTGSLHDDALPEPRPQPAQAHPRPRAATPPDKLPKKTDRHDIATPEDPRTKFEQQLAHSVKGLYQTRATFERVARVYFKMETAGTDQSVDALYRKIIDKTTEADPLHKTWRHISYAIPHSLSVPINEAGIELLESHVAEADQLLEHFQNIQKIPEGERQAFGKTASNAQLKTFTSMLANASRNYKQMISARQALTDMA